MTTDDTSTWDHIDEHRCAPLDDVGLPGYVAAVVVTAAGEERLVLACREALNRPVPYWPDWRETAPHELIGAPICGSRATVTGRPCGVHVREWGRTCATHARAELRWGQS